MLEKKYTQNSSGVWSQANGEVVDYSDGDAVEDRFLRQLRKVEDLSVASDELQQLIVDWPSEYHFSPLRANLLAPFSFENFGHILEIGSGCGAITRVLGEKCPDSQIVALEGSARRAEITKARCRDLGHVEVCHESFTSFEPGIRFDCITLIGVLEYSPSYFRGTDPVLETITKAKSLLRPNGVLIVAIENQLGLKYFNGCSEDHSGHLFTGVNGLYGDGKYKTFGKKELENKIRNAGFTGVDFVYPFPDYKLPRLLLRDSALRCAGFDVGSLPGQFPSRDYTGNRERFFHETGVWPLLAKNDILGDMANSFLIFAYNGDALTCGVSVPWLAKAFSCPRKKRYLSETTFVVKEDGLIVQKNVSYPEHDSSIEGVDLIHHSDGEEPYINGVPYSSRFVKLLSGEGAGTYRKFVDYLKPWVSYLKNELQGGAGSGDIIGASIAGTLLDCLPSNLIIGAHNEIQVFDQEWESTKPLSFGFLLFRGIYRELSVHMSFLEETDMFVENGGSAWSVLHKVFAEFSCEIDVRQLGDYIAREVAIQKQLIIYNASEEELERYLTEFFLRVRPQKTDYDGFVMAGGLTHLLRIEQEKITVASQLLKMEEELVIMRSCLSWKLGRLLTYIPRLLRRKKTS